MPADLWEPFNNESSYLLIGQNECTPAYGIGKSVGCISFWNGVFAGDTKTLHNMIYGDVW